MTPPRWVRTGGGLAAGAAAGLTLWTTACAAPSTAEETKAAPAGPPTIEVVRVAEQPVNLTLSMPGELAPYQTVATFARVTGFVKTIRVDRGARVSAGDVLAVLEAPELVANRMEAQSKLQAAEAQLGAVQSRADAAASTYDKLKAAAETPGVVAGNDLVLAQKALEADRGQVVAAQRHVDAARQAVASVTEMEGYLRVTAPFDGVVTERNVHPGALVGPASGPGASTPLLRLIDGRRLRIVIPVPESYAAGVSTGAEIAFSVAAYPGQTFTGKIARIAPSVDVGTRTMAVELDVVNSDGRLAAGAFCQVRWPVHRRGPSLLAPSGSIASTTDRTFVVRVRDGRAEWVDVKAGLTIGPLVEIFGNLRAGDVIATRGTDQVRSGTEVHTRVAKPTGP
jgi:membrane fusion protein (multidrug efflux system)